MWRPDQASPRPKNGQASSPSVSPGHKKGTLWAGGGQYNAGQIAWWRRRARPCGKPVGDSISAREPKRHEFVIQRIRESGE